MTNWNILGHAGTLKDQENNNGWEWHAAEVYEMGGSILRMKLRNKAEIFPNNLC